MVIVEVPLEPSPHTVTYRAAVEAVPVKDADLSSPLAVVAVVPAPKVPGPETVATISVDPVANVPAAVAYPSMVIVAAWVVTLPADTLTVTFAEPVAAVAAMFIQDCERVADGYVFGSETVTVHVTGAAATATVVVVLAETLPLVIVVALTFLAVNVMT